PRPQGDVSAGGAPVYASAPVRQPVYNAYPAASAPVSAPAVTAGPALAPVARASLDTTVTGSTQPVRSPAPVAPAVVQQPAPTSTVTSDGNGGWSRAGGTQITVKSGETVYNLSRRFGMPTDAILKANGL